MNGMNEKTQESHECKRQLRHLRSSSEKEITVIQKTNASEDCDSAEIYQPQINSENLEINCNVMHKC